MKKSSKITSHLISKYSERIHLDPLVVKEFEKSYLLVQKLKTFRVKHAFVENEVNERGGHNYPNFCFFGQGLYGEVANAKEKVGEQEKDLFIIDLAGGLAKVAITNYVDFDFANAGDGSRVSIAFSLKNGESFYLNAAGRNCDVLLEIYQQYLMPRLKVGT
jgi:hypothetical protein